MLPCLVTVVDLNESRIGAEFGRTSGLNRLLEIVQAARGKTYFSTEVEKNVRSQSHIHQREHTDEAVRFGAGGR